MIDKYKLTLSGTIVVSVAIIFGAAIAQPTFSQNSTSRVVSAPFSLDEIPFVACGYMGDATEQVQIDLTHKGTSRPDDEDGSTIQVVYESGGSLGWAGVYWLPPAPPPDDCNWGRYPGITVTNATKVVFWAKGEQGGERVEFKAGGVFSEKPNDDSFESSLGRITLTAEWQKYEIDLSNQNLESVLGSFAWAAPESESSAMIFYLDDIRYE